MENEKQSLEKEIFELESHRGALQKKIDDYNRRLHEIRVLQLDEYRKTVDEVLKHPNCDNILLRVFQRQMEAEKIVRETMRRNVEEKRFCCECCNKVFGLEEQLNLHNKLLIFRQKHDAFNAQRQQEAAV